MRHFKYRALLTMDVEPGEWDAGYPSGTHKIMIRCPNLGQPGQRRYFPAAIYRDDDGPLAPGGTAIVTIDVPDDDAAAYFGPGQHVTLWNGHDIGHGVISRRVFFNHGPG